MSTKRGLLDPLTRDEQNRLVDHDQVIVTDRREMDHLAERREEKRQRFPALLGDLDRDRLITMTRFRDGAGSCSFGVSRD